MLTTASNGATTAPGSSSSAGATCPEMHKTCTRSFRPHGVPFYSHLVHRLHADEPSIRPLDDRQSPPADQRDDGALFTPKLGGDLGNGEPVTRPPGSRQQPTATTSDQAPAKVVTIPSGTTRALTHSSVLRIDPEQYHDARHDERDEQCDDNAMNQKTPRPNAQRCRSRCTRKRYT